MAIALITDRILEPEDAQELFGLDSPTSTKTAVLINSLTKQFLKFTGRSRVTSGSVVETIKGIGGNILYLRAFPVDTGSEVTLEIVRAGTTIYTYTLTGEDFHVLTDDYQGRVEMVATDLPGPEDPEFIRATYTGGFDPVPGDVVEGAILQGRVELRRMDGEVGITSRSVRDENTSFEKGGIIAAVRELWEPYRVVI